MEAVARGGQLRYANPDVAVELCIAPCDATLLKAVLRCVVLAIHGTVAAKAAYTYGHLTPRRAGRALAAVWYNRPHVRMPGKYAMSTRAVETCTWLTKHHEGTHTLAEYNPTSS